MAMLHSVKFLCSVVAAFARLAHVLSKALASMFSPTSVPAATASGGPPPEWWKVHPVIAANAVHDKQVMPPPVAFARPPPIKAGNLEEEARKEAVRPAARGRPPRLVIPAARCGSGEPFGEAEAAAGDREREEVEVEGEGFCMASRKGVRHAMEDGYGVITQKIGDQSQLAFYGVYDGHGGRTAVDFISERLGKNIVTTLATMETQQLQTSQEQQINIMDVIRAGYLTTDKEFLNKGVRGGACAATALVKDSELYVANVGDCRAVISTGGIATALTTDHTASCEDERARIENMGGYVGCGTGVWRVQGCLAVSRAFGDLDMKKWVISEPQIKRMQLTPDCEFLVIASDGLWNKVSNQEAVDVVSKNNNVKYMDSCKELVNMARSRGSRDDISVMVVDLQRFLHE